MAVRKLSLLMLLAGAATPALAAPDDDAQPDRRGNRAERSQSDSDTQRRDAPAVRTQSSSEPRENANRSRGGRRAFGGGSPANVDAPRAPRNSAGNTVGKGRQDDDGSPVARVKKEGERPTLPERPATERRRVAPEAGDSVRDWRRADRRGDDGPATTIEDRNLRTAPNVREGGVVQPRRPLPRVLDSERRISRTPVFGTEPAAPRTAESRQARSHRWNHQWRHDHRYDWRDWRRRHRSRFHIGLYYDPFGWNYFRYGIGWRLWPNYYRSSYWLNEPSYYRLPPAYGPYRWIRYHNDALLVNIYSGQVVDVIYDFFW